MCGITGCVFKNLIDFDLKQFKKIDSIVFDTRSFLSKEIVDGRL